MKALSEYKYMIIDDVRSTRIATQGILTSVDVKDIWHAENGHEALSMLQMKAQDVNCIISDFNMPIMHGLQMVKHIRSSHENIQRDIPILMLTGYGDQNLLGVAMALDVNAFLVKPTKRPYFLNRLQKMLQIQESGERWIKPVESYMCIDSNFMVESILEKSQVDIKLSTAKADKEEDRISKAIKEQQQRHRIKSALQSGIHNIEEDVPIVAQEPSPTKSNESSANQKSCHLDSVPRNSILAKDLLGRNERKLLSASSKLTKGMIDRLKDLRDLGEPVDQIWIHKNNE